MGADVVGGSPTLSQDPNEHIDAAFEMAMARDLPVDMHIDESDNPDDQCLEILAEKTLAEGYQGASLRATVARWPPWTTPRPAGSSKKSPGRTCP